MFVRRILHWIGETRIVRNWKDKILRAVYWAKKKFGKGGIFSNAFTIMGIVI